jgi:hypothetical protein
MLTTPARNMQADDYIATMFQALNELGALNEVYRQQLMEAVTKSSDYKELSAKTFLTVKASGSKMTVDELKAQVADRVSASERAAAIAEAVMKATREAMDLRKEAIDACQSALAYSRAEMTRTTSQEPNIIRQEAWTP